MTQAEKERRWGNWLWLGGAAAVLVTYVLFSGHVIEFEMQEEEDFEED